MRRRVVQLACPTCGAALPARTVLPGAVDCGACGNRYASLPAGVPTRSLVPPQVSPTRAQAAALAAWRHPLAPPGFPGRPEPPRLLHVAAWEVERTLERPRAAAGEDPLVEVRARALAFWRPELGLTELDLEAALDAPGRRPFEPATGDAALIDPVRTLEHAVPPPPGVRVVEERAEIVFAPLWKVRCRHRGDAWDAVVDGVGGRVLFARAPVERSARLGVALALLLPVALLVGLPTEHWRSVGEAAVRTHPFLPLLALAGLAGLVSETWDRIRFRHEWRVEGPRAHLQPVNRPDETWLQWIARTPFRLLHRPLLVQRDR
ncbi:MAG: hypothetical protein KJ067_23045 [Vicinamibacteria bacterium]|nr:hypothetical protein [Vicinamibacteria bacterium]